VNTNLKCISFHWTEQICKHKQLWFCLFETFTTNYIGWW